MRAGYLKTSCGSCHAREPEVRDALGCNPLVSANVPAWQIQGETVTSFMNCPRMFIPETVWNFGEMHSGYQKKRFALPAVGNQPKKYLEMCRIYEASFPHFQYMRDDDDRRAAQMRQIGSLGI